MLKKSLKIFFIVLAAAVILAQLYRPDRTNPQVVHAETLEAAMTVPDDVKAIINRSCIDCHSNNTRYPWYSNISPVSWFLQDHIEHGRSHLNFSVWATYDTRRKTRRLEEICEQVESGAMPLPSYLWIHSEARLREGEVGILCRWAHAEKARLEGTPQ
jgi:hypothetical protein